MCKGLILDGVLLPPGDILQPPGHGIHQVLQVHEVSISLLSTEFVIASSTEIAAP
jgi:hypothetical protein